MSLIACALAPSSGAPVRTARAAMARRCHGASRPPHALVADCARVASALLRVAPVAWAHAGDRTARTARTVRSGRRRLRTAPRTAPRSAPRTAPIPRHAAPLSSHPSLPSARAADADCMRIAYGLHTNYMLIVGGSPRASGTHHPSLPSPRASARIRSLERNGPL